MRTRALPPGALLPEITLIMTHSRARRILHVTAGIPGGLL